MASVSAHGGGALYRLNWPGLAACGLLTGAVWTVLSAMTTALIGGGFNAAVGGNKLLAPGAGLASFLLVVNLCGGIWAMWLYAAIRPRYGAGPRTAVIAGLAWWIVSTLADATWGSFGFVPVKALLPLSLVSLPEMTMAVICGAWRYRE